jgi:beta-N-acetylhexosaminidase
MRYRVLALPLLLAACTSSAQVGTTSPHPTPRTSTTHTARPSTPPPTTAPPSTTAPPPVPDAQRIFDAMSERERVGQLLMVDCSTTGVSPATTTAITQFHVGSVILDGTSYAGLQETRAVTSQLQSLAPRGVGLFISTDQEGGLVQRLQGPGFTRIVSAVQQGTIAPDTLRGYAEGWGSQLRRAGVNVNLAPVLDTVPAGFGPNPPIGDLDREYGHTPAVVTAHGLAVARGMAAAGVDVTVKHFPGLGRVSGNTDTTTGVTDSVTTRHDAYLAPFQAAIRAGVPFAMMSTAIYALIDPGMPAAFSRTIVTGMLRGDLGFRGLIISDDLGGAQAVAGYSIGDRAVRFVAAGGDVVLTVDANQAGEMTAALLAKANSDPSFKKKVDAAALLVLQEKGARGLL